ncbi:hypothetical protein ERJ75_000053300 [Trypanosoma vivax]|nr:hypothetical protein TRVL_03624 [Trypanosoma vivax]KAH8620671.1 hypothetical protein ERJ75_000053300 [Trypanosoma vivax]
MPVHVPPATDQNHLGAQDMMRVVYTSDEQAFTRILAEIGSEGYYPNLSERALICRTINASFNPLAFYFACCGALCGHHIARGARSGFHRMLSLCLGSCYFTEFSWAIQDRRPCLSFLRDIRSVSGRLRTKVSAYWMGNQFPLERRQLLWSILGFLTLENTFDWAYSICFAPAHRVEWLRYLKIGWFNGLPLDPLTLLYWRIVLACNK